MTRLFLTRSLLLSSHGKRFYSLNRLSNAAAPASNELLIDPTQPPPAWLRDILKDPKIGKGFMLSNAGLVNQTVEWGDIDSFQHVNNVRYLKWIETSRCFLLCKLGFLGDGVIGGVKPIHQHHQPSNIGPIMRSCEMEWKYPVTTPDRITVIHKLTDIAQDRFFMKAIVISHRARKLAARIHECNVSFDYVNQTKAPIPKDVAERMHKMIKEQHATIY